VETLIFASFFEGFGLPVLEALSLGHPAWRRSDQA